MGADIVLSRRSLELGIDSRLGGVCTYLQYRRTDGLAPINLLRPLPVDRAAAFESSCFAMLPFSNRLIDGRLCVAGGSDQTLPPNSDRVGVPIHGVGWMTDWEIAAQQSDHVRLTYRHAANTYWPFAMVCTQTIGVVDDRVRFEASICNLSNSNMPAGLGFHPRFALAPDTVVTLGAPTVWLQDSVGRPTRLVAATGDECFDFSIPRLARSVELNHCFAGWQGLAALDFPSDQISMCVSASPELRHLVVYRLPGQPWVCIEPVSHATGALSLDALASTLHGARVLRPGQFFSGSMEISLHDHSLT